MTDKLKEMALKLIETIEGLEKKYSKLNKELSDLQGDFPQHIQTMDWKISHHMVRLLDEILGDEAASYYLWECSHMKNGGAIYEKDKANKEVCYELRNIEDLRKYVFREKK